MAKKAKSYGETDYGEADDDDPRVAKQSAEVQSTMPTADEEFVFEDLNSLPAWADRGWAGINVMTNEPLIWVPMHDFPDEGQPMRDQPYSTKAANKGDTVKFVARKGPRPAHLEVIAKEPEEEPVE